MGASMLFSNGGLKVMIITMWDCGDVHIMVRVTGATGGGMDGLFNARDYPGH